MSQHTRLTRRAVFAIALLFPLLGYTQDAVSENEEPIELSPFEVNTTNDNGYMAVNSISGSRLDTPLKDIGASINVLTSEFIEDLGAATLEEALEYGGNVEDNQNSYSGNDNGTFEFFSSFSIRGLPATVTRDFFPWRVQGDNYNVERIEESRGPNSILFGIGSAGGVINTWTKRALPNTDFARVSLMTDNYNSLRSSLDWNTAVVKDKLFVRTNLLYSNIEGYRDFVYTLQKRGHLAATWVVTPTTRVQAGFEAGEIKRTVSRAQSGRDQTSFWEAAGRPVLPTVATSSANQALYGVGVTGNFNQVAWIENDGSSINVRQSNFSKGDNFPITDESIMPFTANPSGPSTRQDSNVRVGSLIIEQKIGDNTHLQLAANYQTNPYTSYIAGLGRGRDLQADPNRIYRDSTEENPYQGQYYIQGERWNIIDFDLKSRDVRLTASHNLDLENWGVYRFAAMVEKEKRDQKRSVLGEYWDGAPFNANPDNSRNQVIRRRYVTVGDFSTYTASGPLVTGLLKDIADPTTPGRLLSSVWLPFNGDPNSLTDTPEEQLTFLGVVQARYLNDRLVVGLGYRRDTLDQEYTIPKRDPAVGNIYSLTAPDAELVKNTFAGNTKTAGVVGHLSDSLSVHFNYSDSIALPNTAHRVLNKNADLNDANGLLPDVSGAKGMDYGFSVQLFDDKLSFRANAFETKLEGAAEYGFGGTLNSPRAMSNRILDALEAEGLIDQAEGDSHRIYQNAYTFNRKATGYEFSLVGNPSRSWRISVSYSTGETINSATAPEIKAWAAKELPYYHTFGDVDTGFGGRTVDQYIADWEADTNRRYFNAEGKRAVGHRKHSISAFVRYTFREGVLKGLYLGGGYRYRSASITGYLDDGSIVEGNSYSFTDGLIGYQIKKLPFLAHGMKLQLNIKNLLDDSKPIATDVRPHVVDGIEVLDYYSFRIVEPRYYRLTASFEF